jgi:hypothetical protein
MALRVVQFLAVVLTALALVPVGAHFFEMPNKIGLARDQYFTVQAIYRGWALFGAVLIPAIVANLVLRSWCAAEDAPFGLPSALSS